MDTNTGTNMFEKFGHYYDKMISWENRIKNEETFYRQLTLEQEINKVLDIGCGTGWHAIMFAKWGLEVNAVDPSSEMIEEARKNAKHEQVDIEFGQLGIEDVSELEDNFDMITCLGNSLAHVLEKNALELAFSDFYSILQERGTLVIQMRNYDKVFINRERFMPQNSYKDLDKEIIFLRMTDLLNEKKIQFNILVFFREGDSDWQFEVFSEPLAPWRQQELEKIMGRVGFKNIRTYGSYKKDSWSMEESKDLIIVAEK